MFLRTLLDKCEDLFLFLFVLGGIEELDQSTDMELFGQGGE